MEDYIRRNSDGQYLRGAMFWKWTRFKFLACSLTEMAFQERLVGGYLEKYGIVEKFDIDLVEKSH
ncbi:hypothetical protein [Vibrio coralliilyticus]|uniref:hypothetical protein n=1 Tax=Vibrio coralliilyticus TaxID=190893 RepID=UPI001E4BEF25|nr:hypothetical protein [Vibrio coralliilyticus]MCC2525552.1 hypothetical protein [Vibrio coralliilyticus]